MAWYWWVAIIVGGLLGLVLLRVATFIIPCAGGANCTRQKRWRTIAIVAPEDEGAFQIGSAMELVFNPTSDRGFLCKKCKAAFCEGCYLRSRLL